LFWVAYAMSAGRSEGRAVTGGRPTAGCGFGLGDADGEHERPASPPNGQTARSGPWSNHSWRECSDGKWRRASAQPGDEPLSYGVPARVGPGFAGMGGLDVAARRAASRNRVGRLRAYGNAIVPQVAAVFVREVMEMLGIKQERGQDHAVQSKASRGDPGGHAMA
jgi:DNA (cytosine-5)-methyltransferase 1